MKALEPAELLRIWERGAGAAPAWAVLPLLAAACPELAPPELRQMTIGERDALLLTQREWMFGPQLEAVATCPHCEECLEFSLTVDKLRTGPALADASGLGQMVSQSAEVEGYQLEFRPPTIADTEEVTSLEGLLARCLIRVTRDGQAQPVSELPPAVIKAVSRRMSAADPQADTRLALSCPACEHEWLATFDIVTFLWEEIHTWAQRTLLEVHQLARAYGWSEAQILALSPARRQIYLTLMGAS